MRSLECFEAACRARYVGATRNCAEPRRRHELDTNLEQSLFWRFRGAVARRSPRVSKETEQRGTMAELHRLWRLETEFGTERPQLTKRKDNKRLL